jgi:predicted ribosome quality control (RQC) complex YloA/Tae2 family protein
LRWATLDGNVLPTEGEEKEQAERKAEQFRRESEQFRRESEQAARKAELFAAKLRELGIDPSELN